MDISFVIRRLAAAHSPRDRAAGDTVTKVGAVRHGSEELVVMLTSAVMTADGHRSCGDTQLKSLRQA